MRLTWQNLTDGKRAGIVSGRAWLWGTGKSAQVARFEWHHSLRPSSLACEVTTGGGDSEGELTFRLSLVFASYYLTFDGMLRRWRKHKRTTGIRLSGDHFVIQWRCDDSSWSSKTGPAAGWQWSCFVLDKLLGRMQYREGAPVVSRFVVEMPEGGYRGTCTLRADSWKRPLWFRRTVSRAHVEMDKGQAIPIPGKGENSWDQDEDALYGSTFPCVSLADAIAHLHADVMRTRERRGGTNWRPTRGPHALAARIP